MTDWKPWVTNPPEAGQKVAILCDDGCSMFAALVVDFGAGVRALEAEDGWDLGPSVGDSRGVFEGALWTALPADYALRFMEDSHD